MINTLKFIKTKIQEGYLLELWKETKWIYMYAHRYWLAIIFYTILGLTGTVVSLGSSVISKNLVDIITGYETSELLKTFCLMIGFAIGNIFLNQITSYASNWISLKVDMEIKADIFEKMLVTDWEALTTYHTGDLLTRWGTDASAISSGILSWIPNLVIYLFRFVSAFTIVIYHDATFAIFALIGVPFSVLMSNTLINRMRNNNQRSAKMSAKMSGFHQEIFSNIQTIKAFNLIKLYTNRLKQLQSEFLGMKMEFQRMSMTTSVLMSLVGLLVSYSSYGWGIYRVFSGAISYGTMTLFLSLSGTLTSALNSLISLVPQAISLTTSAGRLMDILEMPREDYSHNEEVNAFANKHKFDGICLCVSNISYSYANGTKVFKHASFKANPHEIVALVGPSGEGKTTMLRLLLALMRPQIGEIYLCSKTGEESLSMTPSARQLFSYVPQGNTMFSGTIAENMRNIKEDANDEEIINALKTACAWDFVSKLPEGIYSTMKERGGGFSEGQAQRLSIARALLRKSPLLLLDEATSALDVATERKLLKNIMKDEYPRTCIVTTHRPTVLKLCKSVYAIREKQCILLQEEEIKQMLNDF